MRFRSLLCLAVSKANTIDPANDLELLTALSGVLKSEILQGRNLHPNHLLKVAISLKI